MNIDESLSANWMQLNNRPIFRGVSIERYLQRGGRLNGEDEVVKASRPLSYSSFIKASLLKSYFHRGFVDANVAEPILGAIAYSYGSVLNEIDDR